VFQQQKKHKGASKTSNQTIEEQKLLTLNDVAKILRVSARTVWANTAPRGKLPVVRIGKRVLYKQEAVTAFIDASQENGTKDT
jgi:excisionase family DNA binding protein